MNNFTQKLSNPKLLFRSVIVPKSKKTNRMPRKTGINKSNNNNNNNNKKLFGSKIIVGGIKDPDIQSMIILRIVIAMLEIMYVKEKSK